MGENHTKKDKFENPYKQIFMLFVLFDEFVVV